MCFFNGFLVSVLHVSPLMFIKDEKPLISAGQEAAMLFQQRVTEKARPPPLVCARACLCVCVCVHFSAHVFVPEAI